MNVDFIVSRRSVDDIVDCIDDPNFGERSLLYANFLGVGDIVDVGKGQISRLPYDAYPAFQSRLAAGLGDRSAYRARAIKDLMGKSLLWHGDRDATMDFVTAAWLESLGLSAPDLYLLSSFAEEFYIERRDGTHLHDLKEIYFTSYDGDAPTLALTYQFQRFCWWSDGRLDISEDMTRPETVRMAAIGRPLRDVFQHPFLDPHDLIITEWDDPTIIRTDAARVRVFPS